MSESSDQDPFNIERERGIFTKADREYILGEKDLSDQTERNTRLRIRKRLQNAIHDLTLAGFIPEEDRNQVGEKIFNPDAKGVNSLQETIDTVFGLSLEGIEDHDGQLDKNIQNWEDSLESVIEYSVKDENPDAIIDIEVNIATSVSRPDHEELYERYRNNEESYEEFRYLENNDLLEMNEDFWDHLFRHRWENESEFTIFSPEGEVRSLSPEDFDTLGEFRSKGIELLSDFGHIDHSSNTE